MSDLLLTRLRVAWRRFLVGALVAGAFSAFGQANAESSVREDALKAAFLYNFAKFTLWPRGAFASPQSPINFCSYRNSLRLESLGTIEGKRVRNRQALVRVIHNLKNINSCHVLYIGGASGHGVIEQIIQQTAGSLVLTVSDSPGFALRGGHIGLIRSDNRMRFEINAQAAQKRGLKFSSKLLQLAILVDGKQ